MLISAQAARRAVVAPAASGAAVLSMTAASAAGHDQRGLAGTPICPVSRLRVSVGPASGTAGAEVYPLRFTSLAPGTCHLSGHPGSARSAVTGTSWAVRFPGHALPAPLRHAAP